MPDRVRVYMHIVHGVFVVERQGWGCLVEGNFYRVGDRDRIGGRGWSSGRGRWGHEG